MLSRFLLIRVNGKKNPVKSSVRSPIIWRRSGSVKRETHGERVRMMGMIRRDLSLPGVCKRRERSSIRRRKFEGRRGTLASSMPTHSRLCLTDKFWESVPLNDQTSFSSQLPACSRKFERLNRRPGPTDSFASLKLPVDDNGGSR